MQLLAFKKSWFTTQLPTNCLGVIISVCPCTVGKLLFTALGEMHQSGSEPSLRKIGALQDLRDCLYPMDHPEYFQIA